MKITIAGLDALDAAARSFLAALPEGRRVVAFRGGMGAGKTTFIAALARALGSDDDAGSPTFSIVNEYVASHPGADMPVAPGDTLYHFDFYRLDDPAEALEIGVEDYFASGRFCFVEWPERIGSLLPDDAVEVEIAEDEESGARVLTISERQ